MHHADEKKRLIENYREYFQRFGDTPEGVQYGSAEGQAQRFSKLVEVAPLDGCKVLDLGCGLGHLYPFIRSRFADVAYTGVDIVPDTVDHAAKRYPEAEFHCFDILSGQLQDSFDYVLLNGLFNNALAGSDDYMHDLLRAAFALCERGMAFNFTSTVVGSRDATMAYHDPGAVLGFCISELTPKVSLHHHYARCDVAVFAYRV